MTSRKPAVLVVDDDMRMLRMMRRILELDGYHVITAGTAEAAFVGGCRIEAVEDQWRPGDKDYVTGQDHGFAGQRNVRVAFA